MNETPGFGRVLRSAVELALDAHDSDDKAVAIMGHPASVVEEPALHFGHSGLVVMSGCLDVRVSGCLGGCGVIGLIGLGQVLLRCEGCDDEGCDCWLWNCRDVCGEGAGDASGSVDRDRSVKPGPGAEA